MVLYKATSYISQDKRSTRRGIQGEEILSYEGEEAWEQVAHRSCGLRIAKSAQGQIVAWQGS